MNLATFALSATEVCALRYGDGNNRQSCVIGIDNYCSPYRRDSLVLKRFEALGIILIGGYVGGFPFMAGGDKKALPHMYCTK